MTTDLGSIVDSAADADWAIFALDGAGGGAGLDGSMLMAPNVDLQVIENDEIEELRFLRDESANLVWAWERQIADASGKAVATDTETPSAFSPTPAAADPEFRLKSSGARAWIPYVPRQISQIPALSG